MKYIILDMEWNQPVCTQKTVTKPFVLHGEVVQIGAVKLDDNYRIVDTFETIVMPKHYKKMNKKVQKLTGITADTLKEGLPFPLAFEHFKNWCGDSFVILTWGPDDIKMLCDNMMLHNIDTSWIPKWYNLQVIFDAQIAKEHRQKSLCGAIEQIGEKTIDAHDALNDAKMTAIICQHLSIDEGIDNYERLKQNFLSPESDDIQKQYNSKKEALRDPEVITFKCEKCGATVCCTEFVSQNRIKTVSRAVCQNGAEYYVRFKFLHNENKTIRVKRYVSKMTDEYRAYYLYKKQNKTPHRNYSTAR